MLTVVKCRTRTCLLFDCLMPPPPLSQLNKTHLSLFPSIVGLFSSFLPSILQWFLIKAGNVSVMLSYFLNVIHFVPLCHQAPYTWITHDLCILTWGRSKTRQNKIQWLKAQQIQTRRHIKSGWSADPVPVVQFAQTEKQRYFFYHGKLPC